MSIALEMLLIFTLILANGVFALAEIAIVSSRKVRLQQQAEAGHAGARAALDLATQPTRFLSTVQIGITLVGILAGAFGGATLAETLGAAIAVVPGLAPYGDAIGLAIVVVAIAYLSLVVGELLPKRLALGNPERIAAAMARPMAFLSRALAPAVSVLTGSTDLILRVFGVRLGAEAPVSAEEIRILIEQGRRVGVFEATEQDLVEGALELGEQRAGMLITPRTEVVWIDLTKPLETARDTIIGSRHAFFPAARGDLDNVEGLLRGRDVLGALLTGQPVDLTALLHPPLFVPESRPVLELLDLFRTTGEHIALIIDEFGGLQGIVTLTDVVEALVGAIHVPGQPNVPEATQRADGSWLLDGRLTLPEARDLLGLNRLPPEGQHGYDTLGGFVMAMLGRIPVKGQAFVYEQLRFEVVDMDGRRVDQVLVAPAPPAAQSGDD
jgi:putative hemolysin